MKKKSDPKSVEGCSEGPLFPVRECKRRKSGGKVYRG